MSRTPRGKNKDMESFDKSRVKHAIKYRKTTVKKLAVQLFSDDRTDEEKRIKLQRYIDNGRMPMFNFFAISNILNVSIAYLKGITEDNNTIQTAEEYNHSFFSHLNRSRLEEIYPVLLNVISLFHYDSNNDDKECENEHGIIDDIQELANGETKFKNSGKTPEENINASDLLKGFKCPIIVKDKEFFVENESAIIHYLQICMLRLYLQQGLIIEKDSYKEDPISTTLDRLEYNLEPYKDLCEGKYKYTSSLFHLLKQAILNDIHFITEHSSELNEAQMIILKKMLVKATDIDEHLFQVKEDQDDGKHQED